jgi:hypothetical protein
MQCCNKHIQPFGRLICHCYCVPDANTCAGVHASQKTVQRDPTGTGGTRTTNKRHQHCSTYTDTTARSHAVRTNQAHTYTVNIGKLTAKKTDRRRDKNGTPATAHNNNDRQRGRPCVQCPHSKDHEPHKFEKMHNIYQRQSGGIPVFQDG